MTEFFLSATFYKAEPFSTLRPATVWLWFESIAWTTNQGWKGRIPAVAVRFYAKRTHTRRTRELLDVGLWIEEEPGVYRIAREWNGQPLWRPSLPTNPRPYISRHVRNAVYQRDGHACVTCGTTERLSLDHIHPYSQGGPDTVENLQTMCRPCNSSKGAWVDG